MCGLNDVKGMILFMDNKLQILLNKININNEYYKYFDNSKLLKIVGNKERDSYTFFIEIFSLFSEINKKYRK